MTAAEPRAHRDPILDPPRKKKKGLSTGALVGITMSVIVHLLAGMWLYNEKFKLQVFDYNDDAVDVEIVEPLPPPPPPPPPDTPPPPPKLQIRPPVINTDAPPPPVTLQIVATKKEDRVEYTGPPVIVPGPPPPPAPAAAASAGHHQPELVFAPRGRIPRAGAEPRDRKRRRAAGMHCQRQRKRQRMHDPVGIAFGFRLRTSGHFRRSPGSPDASFGRWRRRGRQGAVHHAVRPGRLGLARRKNRRPGGNSGAFFVDRDIPRQRLRRPLSA